MGSRPPSDQAFLAIVNPAAGGGRGARRAPAVIERLRAAGLDVTVRFTEAPGDGIRLARQGYDEGFRSIIAGGGDGTAFEVLNGCFPLALERDDPVRLGFLPLGTGNAYLQDFSKNLVEHSVGSLEQGQRRTTDVAALHHQSGVLYFINLMGFGLPVQVTTRAIRLKRFGALGYILGVFLSLAGLRYPKLPLRLEDGERFGEPVVQFTISNSRYTANGMLIAPNADLQDGKVDLVSVDPMARLSVARAFPRLFKGNHLELDTVHERQAETIHFEGNGEVEVMIDGELRRVVPERVEVLRQALEIWA